MNRKERITTLLARELAPIYMDLVDDSAKHAGHSGAQPGGQTHYSLTIKADCFSKLNKIQRHQMIYALLADEFKTGLHALAIDAKTPDEN